jgi:hypothetical protein
MTTDMFQLELVGTVHDAHANFPIRFDFSENGTAFLIGAKFVAKKKVGNKEIENRIDLRAFGEEAEALAHLQDGAKVHVIAEYGMSKGKDDKWYPVATVTQVIEA